MKRGFILQLVTAVVLVSAFGLSWASSPVAVSQVEASKPIRIVALAPHLVEILYAVGAGDTLVGAVEHSDYPEQALLVPRIGGYTSINIEAVLRLQPDWVLAWESGNGSKVIRKLKSLGVKVYVSEPGKLESIATLLKDIGELSRGNNTEQAVSDYEKKYKNLKSRYSERTPVSVFYQVWNKPLQTLSDKSIVGDVIKLCGGRNIFANELAIAPKTNVESILSADPQTIVASGMGEERPQWLDQWLDWPQLQAVKNEHLFFVPPDLIQRHSPRLLEGAEILCQQLQQVRSQQSQLED